MKLGRLLKMIDIGANLTNGKFHNDVADVIQRSKDAGLTKIILTGTCIKTSNGAQVMANTESNFLRFTAGVHPHDAKTFTSETLATIERLTQDPLCCAVGECGLDFNRNFSTPDQQREAFEKQLVVACRLKKPLFIHERDAHEDMRNMLQVHISANELPPTVIHCFTGTAAQMKSYLDMGLYIGLTGFLWKDRSDNGVIHALKTGVLPLDRLLIETDAPYMYPNIGPKNKKMKADIRSLLPEEAMAHLSHCSFDRNEPCSLAATSALIAAYMGVQVDELRRRTTENAESVFAL